MTGTEDQGNRSQKHIRQKLAQIKTAADEEVDGVANMTGDKCVEFQVHLSDTEAEATTWSIAEWDTIANQLQMKIDRITLNEQMQFKQELSIS
jgi:hypothetical protein